MRIDIDGQLVNIRKGEDLLVLPLSSFPREFIAFVDSGNTNKATITPSQQAQLDRQCFECG